MGKARKSTRKSEQSGDSSIHYSCCPAPGFGQSPQAGVVRPPLIVKKGVVLPPPKVAAPLPSAPVPALPSPPPPAATVPTGPFYGWWRGPNVDTIPMQMPMPSRYEWVAGSGQEDQRFIKGFPPGSRFFADIEGLVGTPEWEYFRYRGYG